MPLLDSGQHRAERGLDPRLEPRPVRVGRVADYTLGQARPWRVLRRRAHRVFVLSSVRPVALRGGSRPDTLTAAAWSASRTRVPLVGVPFEET